MCQILLTHYEKLKISFEKHKPKTFGVLITIISDDTVQYVDNCLDFYCAKIENSKVRVMLPDDSLYLRGQHRFKFSLLLLLGQHTLRNEILSVEQRIKDALQVLFLLFLLPVLVLLCLVNGLSLYVIITLA